jgi:hypothetical protein
MSLLGGRGGRTDDWASDHARAQARAAERLTEPLAADETAWLEAHLERCNACRVADAEFVTQRQELRALRDRQPVPPRDLWARTAAAIEMESRFRDRAGARSRRSALAPFVLLTGGLVVAVVVGLLTSSQRPQRDTTAAASSGTTAVASPISSSTRPAVTPVPIPTKKVPMIAPSTDGTFRIQLATVAQVCPPESTSCDKPPVTEEREVALASEPESVISSPSKDALIVVDDGDGQTGGTVSVFSLAAASPGASPSGSIEPTPSNSVATASPTLATSSASAAPASPPASSVPTPSVSISPSASPGGPVEIASNVVVVGQSAAYSPSGAWFAFTARAVDTVGPDIYVWRVGDPQAHALTQDHRSAFGSWAGEQVVGSRAIDEAQSSEPESFVADPATGAEVALRSIGRVWRPSVDPGGSRAVYWTGSITRGGSGSEQLPSAGRLVIGDWDRVEVAPSASGSALPSADASASSSNRPGNSQAGSKKSPAPSTGAGPSANASSPLDQGSARHEVTLASGEVVDWDARWNASGSRLAVWVATDRANPAVGTLSLYAVDRFDGTVDIEHPLVKDKPARAGFSITDDRLVWAEPAAAGSSDRRILVFAWTDQGSGTVESVQGQVIVIR